MSEVTALQEELAKCESDCASVAKELKTLGAEADTAHKVARLAGEKRKALSATTQPMVARAQELRALIAGLEASEEANEPA